MNGEAHWMDPLLMVVGGVALVLLIGYLSRPVLVERVRRSFACPRRTEAVHGVLLRSRKTGAWTAVERCSGCSPSFAVTCDCACLADLNHPTGGAAHAHP
jgi:hypothetical protein